MANIFEELMSQNRSLTEGLIKSKKGKTCKNESVKIKCNRIKLESRSIFEESDFDDLDQQFDVSPEDLEKEGNEDEVVLIIDPSSEEGEVPEEAAADMVGDSVYKCPVCGANYVCNCDSSKNEGIEVDEEGVPTECPICGETETDQILIGEIAPADESAGEETGLDPQKPEEDDFEEESVKSRKYSRRFNESIEDGDQYSKWSSEVTSVVGDLAENRPYKDYDRGYAQVEIALGTDSVEEVVRRAESQGFEEVDRDIRDDFETGNSIVLVREDDDGNREVLEVVFDSRALVRFGYNEEDDADYFDDQFESVKSRKYSRRFNESSGIPEKFSSLSEVKSYLEDHGSKFRLWGVYPAFGGTVRFDDDEKRSIEGDVDTVISAMERNFPKARVFRTNKKGDRVIYRRNVRNDYYGVDPNQTDTQEVYIDILDFEDSIDLNLPEVAEGASLNLDDHRFESLMTNMIKENYKNGSNFKITKATSRGKTLKLEYVVRGSKGKVVKGVLVGEGFNSKSRKMSIKFKDKGAFTESFRKKPSFVVECVRVKNNIIPTSMTYDFTKRVNESLYRVSGKVEGKTANPAQATRRK